MAKRFIRNSPLYLLTLANLAYAVKHGFSWLTWTALALTGCSIALELFCWWRDRRNAQNADA